jgi:hypothetical protein
MSKLSLNRVPLLGRVVLLAALAGAITLTFLREEALACPPYANVQYKYAEPQFINHVGTRWVNCEMPFVVQQGTMTQHSITEYLDDCICCPAGGCTGGD